MSDANSLLLFMIATVTLNVTPGPDMLYVIARSVGQGRAAGIASALGIAAGCFVHLISRNVRIGKFDDCSSRAQRI